MASARDGGGFASLRPGCAAGAGTACREPLSLSAGLGGRQWKCEPPMEQLQAPPGSHSRKEPATGGFAAGVGPVPTATEAEPDGRTVSKSREPDLRDALRCGHEVWDRARRAPAGRHADLKTRKAHTLRSAETVDHRALLRAKRQRSGPSPTLDRWRPNTWFGGFTPSPGRPSSWCGGMGRRQASSPLVRGGFGRALAGVAPAATAQSEAPWD